MPQVLSYGGDDLDTLCAWLLHRQALLPASMAATVASLNASHAAYPPPRQQQLCALARTYIAPIRHACAHLEFDLDPAETMHELQLSTGHRLHASLGSLAPLPPLLLFVPQLAAAFHTQAAATAVHCVPPLPDYGGRTVPSTQPSEWGDVWDDEYLAESAAPLRGEHPRCGFGAGFAGFGTRAGEVGARGVMGGWSIYIAPRYMSASRMALAYEGLLICSQC